MLVAKHIQRRASNSLWARRSIKKKKHLWGIKWAPFKKMNLIRIHLLLSITYSLVIALRVVSVCGYESHVTSREPKNQLNKKLPDNNSMNRSVKDLEMVNNLGASLGGGISRKIYTLQIRLKFMFLNPMGTPFASLNLCSFSHRICTSL